MKKILYIIALDKFTKGFVEFLKCNYFDFEQHFVAYGNDNMYKFNDDNILFLKNYKQISKKSNVYKWALEANLIIVSGLFGAENCFLKLPKKTIDKTYLMFWGGDFYPLKKSISIIHFKTFVKRKFKINLINNCSGVINLISQDYNELCKVCRPKGKHFIAPMCDNGTVLQLYDEIGIPPKSKNPYCILLGNSATSTNCHKKALDLLAKFKDENIEILCPLSYGDENYAKEIIEFGKKIFDKKFIALTEFMAKDEYFKLLGKCKVAIFNNNRQQAMGNIYALLSMGAKVYIRNDTAMWYTFSKKLKYKIYDLNKINNFNDFILFDKKDMEYNHNLTLKLSDNSENVKMWNKVFESIK